MDPLTFCLSAYPRVIGSVDPVIDLTTETDPQDLCREAPISTIRMLDEQASQRRFPSLAALTGPASSKARACCT